DVLIGRGVPGIDRHPRPRLAQLAVDRLVGQRRGSQLRPRPALPLVAVALPAAVGDVDLLAVDRVALGRGVLGEGGAGDSGGGQARQGQRKNQVHAHPLNYRPCATTSIRAGSPFVTTARARLIAGPRSLGFSTGPSAYMPIDFAIWA